MPRPRRGSQAPTFSTVGEWAYTLGDEAVDLFTRYRIRFYESQELELRVFLARDGDGGYSAKTVCVSKPRQNGKSYAARFYALWMAAIEGKNVLYSAHHGKTVRKMFKELRSFVEGTPDFAALLVPGGRGVYAAAGSEGIYFVDEDGAEGGRIEFQTRTNSAARGETYQVIIVDEAQELTDEQLEALKPTTFAASDVEEDPDADPQMIYLGTPPNVKCPGTVFRDYHDKAHEDPSTAIWWMEWAVPEVPDMADRDAVMELVYLTNPAMGYRIKESTMRDAIDTMKAEGFARECLGWWSAARTVAHPIAAADWDACLTEAPPDDGVLAYAVKFSPDGLSGTVAACVAPEDGTPYVEVVESRSMARGIGWFAGFVEDVADVASAIAVDGKANSQTLVDRLAEDGVDSDLLVMPTAADMVTACSALVDATRARAVAHMGQPLLDASAKLSGKRRIGAWGGYGFESNENADATLVEACALAYWCAMSIRRNPQSELRVG